MRRFIDFNVHPREGTLTEVTEHAQRLGFNMVAVESDRLFDQANLASRVTLSPRNPQQLLKQLRMVRFSHEVVAVYCSSKTVARQAGRDHRVDVVKFPVKGRTHLDRHQIQLMKETGSAVEIDLKHLLHDHPDTLRANIKSLTRTAAITRRSHIPLVLASGATTTLEMREPRALTSLATLIGVPEEEALEMVSTVPMGIIERNREKLQDGYVSPSVRIV